MSKELVTRLLELRDEFQEYQEELNLTIERIAPTRSGTHLMNIANSYIDILCKQLGVSKEYFLTKRSRDVLYYRYSLMAWLKFNTTLTLKDIGRNFGNKDHSTVINSVQAVRDAIQLSSRNQELSDIYYKIRQILD